LVRKAVFTPHHSRLPVFAAMTKTQNDLQYSPKRTIMISGEMAVLKLLERPEGQAMTSFFSQVSDQEADVLRHDVRDPVLIAHWVDTLDYGRTLPLVAWDEGMERIIGVSTLHRAEGVYRHIADVRIFVGKEYRKLGLGSCLIKELIEIGNQLGLFFLRAEILMRNDLAIKAFRQMGFEAKCTLEDHFMTHEGKTYDVMLLMKRLRINMEEDFFYVF
jgi:L-amino acid N-acyltransferase YncA